MKPEPVVVAAGAAVRAFHSAPAVVVHGRHDRAQPPQQGPELVGQLPDAEFRFVDAGHTPVHETPDVAAAVLDLLAQIRDR